MLLGVLMLGAIVRPTLPLGRALRVPGVAASPAAVGAAAAPLLLRRGKRSRVPARVNMVRPSAHLRSAVARKRPRSSSAMCPPGSLFCHATEERSG